MTNQIRNCPECKQRPDLIRDTQDLYHIICPRCLIGSLGRESLEKVISVWKIHKFELTWMQAAIGSTMAQIRNRGHQNGCWHRKPLSTEGYWNCDCGYDSWDIQFEDQSFDARWWGEKYV